MESGFGGRVGLVVGRFVGAGESVVSFGLVVGLGEKVGDGVAVGSAVGLAVGLVVGGCCVCVC